MYPIDFYGSKDYWKILRLPIVNENSRVSNTMSMQIIKEHVEGELDYTISKLEENISSCDFENMYASLCAILDVINAYLTFRDPILFYKYNCYLTKEDAYETSDPYCGYRYLFVSDFDVDREKHFIKSIKKAMKNFENIFEKNEIFNKWCENTQIKNMVDAIMVGIEDVITKEQYKTLVSKYTDLSELYGKVYGDDYARTNGLKLK